MSLSFSDLSLLSPELCILITGALVLVLDLVFMKRANRRNWLPWIGVAGLVVALVLTALLWGNEKSTLGGMIAVDGFALFFKVIAIVATILVLVASWDYMRGKTAYEGEFYFLLLMAALGIVFAVGATDLIMVYLAMEFISITSYILVGYFRDDARSNEGSLKYFLYGSIASAVMLYGMSLVYGVAGTTSLSAIATTLKAGGLSSGMQWLLTPAVIMILSGFGFKMALVPFHQWSPDAYEGAPTPVTAFLSVGPKAAGFAILLRVFLTAFLKPDALQGNWIGILAGIAMVTMTLGNLVALKQKNIKRMLAYSSIAQAGYILVGFVSVSLGSNGSFNGINGVLVYLLGYLFTNLGVFASVIAFEQATGSNDIPDYAGLMKRSPWLGALMFIQLLSLAGIPPTVGFIGKFLVFGAAINMGFLVLALIAIINSVIAAFYYLNVARYIFFVPASQESRVRIPASLAVVVGITAVATLGIGLFPQPLIDLAARSAHLLGV